MNIDWLINTDKDLLLQLNGSDSLFWDYLMTGITSTVAWIPVAVALLYVIIKNNTLRETGLVILFIGLTILLADQFTSSFCKPFFARFRPAQDPTIMYLVDVVDGYRGGRYGFVSSHAANTFGLAILVSLLIKNKWMTTSLMTWAILCSYSRIYLGVHYPGDIICGMIIGLIIGVMCYAMLTFILRKISSIRRNISNQYTSTGYAIADLNVFQTILYATYLVLIIRAVTII